jgi:hypothetical protein
VGLDDSSLNRDQGSKLKPPGTLESSGCAGAAAGVLQLRAIHYSVSQDGANASQFHKGFTVVHSFHYASADLGHSDHFFLQVQQANCSSDGAAVQLLRIEID